MIEPPQPPRPGPERDAEEAFERSVQKMREQRVRNHDAPEQIARAWYEAIQDHSPDGLEWTWEQLPLEDRAIYVAAARDLLAHGVIRAGKRDN